MSTADVNDRTKLLCARCTVRPIPARSKDSSARGVNLQSKSGPPGNTWRAAFLQYHYKRTTSESSSNGLVVRRIESGHRTLLISLEYVRTLPSRQDNVNDRPGGYPCLPEPVSIAPRRLPKRRERLGADRVWAGPGHKECVDRPLRTLPAGRHNVVNIDVARGIDLVDQLGEGIARCAKRRLPDHRAVPR